MSGQGDIFHHVRDSKVFELPQFMMDFFGHDSTTLPSVKIFGTDVQLTKYMVLQVVAAALVFVIFRGLAWHIRAGRPARGRWWTFWEMQALFVRDEIVRPTIGVPHHHAHHDDGQDHGAHAADSGQESVHTHHAKADGLAGTFAHPADRYLPFVWSLFFYVLFCNLLGAIPSLGAATADTSTTSMLALCVFGQVLFAGIRESGFVGFWKSIVPSMDLPFPIALVVFPLLWVIELFGLLVKHVVLAIRLFANMFAGHTVLGVLLLFIAQAADQGALWFLVTPASVAGQVMVSCLELFVAVLQAYVFAFLSTLFISTAVNPH